MPDKTSVRGRVALYRLPLLLYGLYDAAGQLHLKAMEEHLELVFLRQHPTTVGRVSDGQGGKVRLNSPDVPAVRVIDIPGYGVYSGLRPQQLVGPTVLEVLLSAWVTLIPGSKDFGVRYSYRVSAIHWDERLYLEVLTAFLVRCREVQVDDLTPAARGLVKHNFPKLLTPA